MTKATFNKTVEKYSDWRIDKLRIVRQPLPGALQTLGKITSKKHVDKFFHTFSEFALSHPETGEKQVVLLEKNQSLKALEGRSGGLEKSHDAINIDTTNLKGKTLGNYVDNHKNHYEKIGKDFHRYSVLNNNCQIFQSTGLEANGVKTPEAHDFINQNVDEILPSWTGKVLQPVTDLAAKFDSLKDSLFGNNLIKFQPPPNISHLQPQIVIQ